MCNNNNSIWQLRQCNRLLFQLLLSCLEFSGCGGNLFDLAAVENAGISQSGGCGNIAQSGGGCGGCGCGGCGC